MASVYGQHDADWISFYEFFRSECGLKKETERLSGLSALCLSVGWVLPHSGICWVSERHNVCKLLNNRIHCDGGPAIGYPDGWAIWALNGVRVPKWLAETPANTIDPRKLKDIGNAEVRREFIRKVGADRICHKIGKIINESGGYALMTLEVVPGQQRKYLRMNNPSVPGVVHFEPVHPTCGTVQHAINWRAYEDINKPWVPAALT